MALNSSVPRTETLPDLYREIFVHSNEPIAIISPDGHYINQNAAHRNLLGYSDEELSGLTPAIHFGEEAFAAIVRELKEKGQYRGETIARRKDGETRYIELSAFATRDNSGAVICYVGIKRDITERKRVLEELRQRESELTDFFENATVGLHWVGPDGVILRVNQAELDLLGYTREEYVGHNVKEFHVDQNVSDDLLRRLRACEPIHDYEARLRCKDRSVKHVRINSSAYTENGKFVHSRCITSDITNRRRAERRLALQYAVTRILGESTDFIESSKQILRVAREHLDWEVGALWSVDRQAQVMRCIDFAQAPSIEVNGFEQLTRDSVFEKSVGLPGSIWASGEPALIQNFDDTNFPRASAARREGLRGAFGFPILLDQDVLGVLEFFSRENQILDRELLGMFENIGRQIGQVIKRQLADEERAELLESERSARADAEKANRLKDEFLATVSHEIRTPLNAVIGWSRMLRTGKLDDRSASHALEVVERNARAQKQIIEDILDVSRVITGKLQLNLGPVDLVSVVDAALDAVRPALEAKNIKIETIIDAGLKIVPGDADRLQQVVWNLLSNAAKFTPPGGEVDVKVRQSSSFVEIQVSDSGPGIEPKFLPYVFERFRQADGSTTRTHGGLGLGLAIVRHLVELHGGTITVENRDEGSGAIFTVKLRVPSKGVEYQSLASSLSKLKESEPERPSLVNLHILVVDDERDTLDLVTMELAQNGASVTGVTTAAEALNALKSADFDLMISDIAMPEVDGYELIRQIRTSENPKERSIPAVALTAYARVHDRMRAIMAGYNTHVAKPVEANELVTVVASLTGRLPPN